MQEAGIANPNRGLIGKNFLGSGKEYRNHKVPNSIPEIEMRDRIYYNIAPNSLIEVYKEDQAMYNKSFNGPLSQVMSQRSDVIQAANMDSEIEGTEEDKNGSGLFEDDRLRPYAVRSLLYMNDYVMPYLLKHNPDLANRFKDKINTRQISNAIDFEKGKGSGYLYLKNGGAATWADTWNGIKSLGTTVKNIGSTIGNVSTTLGNFSGILSDATSAIKGVTGGIRNGLTSMKDWWTDRMKSNSDVLHDMAKKVKENTARSTDYTGYITSANKYQDRDPFIEENNKNLRNEKKDERYITTTADFMHDKENKEVIDNFYKKNNISSDQVMVPLKLSEQTKEDQQKLKKRFMKEGTIPIDASTVKQFPSLAKNYVKDGEIVDDAPVSVPFKDLSKKDQQKYMKTMDTVPSFYGNERIDQAKKANDAIFGTVSGEKYKNMREKKEEPKDSGFFEKLTTFVYGDKKDNVQENVVSPALPDPPKKTEEEKPKEVPKPAPQPAPKPAPQPAPQPAPKQAPAPKPTPQPAPQPAPKQAPAPQPAPAPEPVPTESPALPTPPVSSMDPKEQEQAQQSWSDYFWSKGKQLYDNMPDRKTVKKFSKYVPGGYTISNIGYAAYDALTGNQSASGYKPYIPKRKRRRRR